MSKLIWEKFLKTVRKNNLVNSHDRILVAVSGGSDSVCLVYFLKKLQKIIEFDLGMVYINHGLRHQRELKKEIDYINQLSRKLNTIRWITKIKLHKPQSNMESKARKLRYKKLHQIATKYNYNKIATGHTLNDNAETVLLNLIRSTNKNRIKGIPLIRTISDEEISIIRPMLKIKKSGIIDFLKKNKIKYCIDSTNRNISFNRNFVRLKILPLMETLNPSVLEHLSNLSK